MDKNYEAILVNAAQEISYVKDCIDDLSGEQETRKLWRAWSGLLTHYVNSVSALRRATSSGPSKGWSDRLLNDQKTDKWLQFAFQARDAANHVFESKREVYHRSVNVGNFISLSGDLSVQMSNNVVLDKEGNVVDRLPEGKLITEDGRYAGGTINRDEISEREHQIILAEVTNRAGTWSLPNPESAGTDQAIEIGEYVLAWLQQKLSEAQDLGEEEKKQIKKN